MCWRLARAVRCAPQGGSGRWWSSCDNIIFLIYIFCFNLRFFCAGVPYPARRPPCNDCVAPSSSTPTAGAFDTTFRWVYMSRSEVMARGVSWRSTREGGGGIYISRQEKVVLADLLKGPSWRVAGFRFSCMFGAQNTQLVSLVPRINQPPIPVPRMERMSSIGAAVCTGPGKRPPRRVAPRCAYRAHFPCPLWACRGPHRTRGVTGIPCDLPCSAHLSTRAEGHDVIFLGIFFDED
jgi:hypothetical protein